MPEPATATSMAKVGSSCLCVVKIRISIFSALTFESRGRRISRSAPAESLILQKATGAMPHRGGIRFGVDSNEYNVLLQWLRTGARDLRTSAPRVTRLQVEPAEVIAVEPDDVAEFRVEAFFSDGTSRDVTDRACYELIELECRR